MSKMSRAPGTPDGEASNRRPPLTREQVFGAALRLVDTEGLEALTRRRLGSELDRDAMALYRFAPDRPALLDGIVELVLEELDVADDGQDWQTQLCRTAHDFRRIGLTHPNVLSLIVTRPLSTPLGLRPLGTLRPLERLLTLLTDAGFPPPLALRIYRLYMGFLHGHLLTELQELVADPDESNDLLRLGLYRLPAREFPLIRGLAGEFAHYDGAAELDQGLAVLFAGLRSELTAALEQPVAGADQEG